MANSKLKKLRKKIISIDTLFIIAIAIQIIYYDTKGFGLSSLLFTFALWIVIAIIKLIKYRAFMVDLVKQIEKLIWGKPLNEMKKGELKNIKVKPKWKKKK